VWSKLIGLPLFAGLLAVTTGVQAQNLYCCQDATSGRRSCADVLPKQCKGLAYKVYDRSGNVISEVGPPLTPEQKAAQEAEAKRKKELEEVMREQRRKDAALLETYGSVKDIDLMLARSEADLIKAMELAEEKIEAARKKRKKFENEAEFYKNRDLPPEVARALRDTDDEIKANWSLLNSKKSDLENMRAKFAADKKRYLEIISGGGLNSHPDARRSPGVPKK